MRFLTRSIVNLKKILCIKHLKGFFLCFCLALAFLLYNPSRTQALLQFIESDNGTSFTRSLENLRDLDYQTWQVVVYPKDSLEGNLALRIVGYPGSLSMDHPSSLEVNAGIRNWSLKDITLFNSKLAGDPREAAAEFDLSPLLNDLTKNRPLRFMLPGVFSDLPIPPYVVNEWRSLLKEQLADEKV